MSTIVKLVQGSPAWHEHRRHHRNASETPAVLGLSPWMTPHQLWQIKTGRAPQPEVTPAMAHGTQLEPLARDAYEKQTGYVMEPLVLVDGEYSASLDGITLDGQLMLEIKCPKSKDSKILAEAKAGRVPVYIYWQMQTQLLVSGAELAHLYVFDGATGILLEQRPEAVSMGHAAAGLGSVHGAGPHRPAAGVDRAGHRDPHRRCVDRRRARVHRGQEAGRRHRGGTGVAEAALARPRPASQRAGRRRVGVALLEGRRHRLQEGAGTRRRRS